jgi:peptide/nickel transport system permease protein
LEHRGGRKLIPVARLLARRLATGVITLFLVTLLVFLLIQLAPGSPLAEDMDSVGLQRMTREAVAELKQIYRLDRPLPEQYLLWAGDLMRGDLGRSFHDRRPVLEKIGERLPISLSLNALSLALMVLLAVPMGAAAALRPDSRWDRLSALGTFALYAVPAFWAGLLLQILFAVRLDWFPLSGLVSDAFRGAGGLARLADRARHLVLPVLCLSYGGLAYLSRFVRAALLENASFESGIAARARGLSAVAVLYRHGFRLAAVPMLTLAGFLLPALIGGSVIVETVFAIPGLGRLFVDAAFQRDLPVLLGLTLLSGAATLAGVVAADLAYALADPRVRRG